MKPESIDKAREFIAQWEGMELSVYLDSAGLPTIGVGHLIQPSEEFETITKEEALELLEQDMSDAIECVDQLVDVELTSEQEAALISFVFNVGCGAFRSSTMLKLINDNMMDSASKQFGRWNKAGGVVVKGLTNRRMAERDLFLS